MITRGNRSATSNNNNRKRNGLPFLTPAEASTTPQPGMIIMARVEDDKFKEGKTVVACRIEFKRQHFLYNLRPNNPVLDTLCDAFSDDETKWANQPVNIFNEEDRFDGKVWLRIEPANGHTEPMVDDEPAVPQSEMARLRKAKQGRS